MAVAQSVQQRIVDPPFGGSSPLGHPASSSKWLGHGTLTPAIPVQIRVGLLHLRLIDGQESVKHTFLQNTLFAAKMYKQNFLLDLLSYTLYYIVIMTIYKKGVRMYTPSKEEKEFLKNYNPGNYQRPSVTSDIVILTVDEYYRLSLLLIKRGNYPYKDCWALPGGFVEINESVDDAARRELKEETHLSMLPIEQIGTFGDVGRDPRMRVISVAYIGFVPKEFLHPEAGDDAAAVQLFEIKQDMSLEGSGLSIPLEDLAFDHAKIIKTALERLQNRVDYTTDIFRFVKNKDAFTVYEARRIYEAIKFKEYDPGNFNRMFQSKYVEPGIVHKTDKKSRNNGGRYASLYSL